MTDGQPEQFSYFKRLGWALVIAVLVTLPFVLTHEDPVTGEIAFAPADVAAGDVRQVKCPFRMPRQHNAACYRAYVPQDHDRPDSPLISILALKLEPAGGASEPDPVLYLEGGPGYAGVPRERDDFGAEGWLRYNYAEFLQSGRAMIFVDTRGLGFAEPALHCPKALRAAWDDLKVHPAERSFETVLAADTECFRALEMEGVDLSTYNSESNALDLKALREGLGIEQWNLYGISYGAQTALSLLEADRAGVRSVIFDSPSYDRVDVFPADQAAFDRALDILEAECLQSPTCGGSLLQRLVDLQDRLRDDPIAVRGYPFGQAVWVGDREAVLVVHDRLYWPEGQTQLSDLLNAMLTRKSGYLASLSNWSMDWHETLYWSYLDDLFSWPVHLTTTCHENNHDRSAGASDWPVYSLAEEDYSRALCDALGIPFRRRVIDAADFAGVPALVLSGERDVITPPAYGRDLASDMGAHYLLHPREAHGVLFWAGEGCLRRAGADFVATLEFSVPAGCVEPDSKTKPGAD